MLAVGGCALLLLLVIIAGGLTMLAVQKITADTRHRGTSGSLSRATLAVQSLFEPGKEHVLEARTREEEDATNAGDGDDGDPVSTTDISRAAP